MRQVIQQLARLRYAAIGAVALVVAGIATLLKAQDPPFLPEFGFTWQVITGLLLLGLLLHQFWMMRVRWVGKLTRLDLVIHRWAGVLAVILFALHAVRVGHVWMTAVTFVFFLVVLSGVFNKEVLQFKRRESYLVWLIIHICASVAIVPLVAIHVWVALAY